jgi:hypothetical protein
MDPDLLPCGGIQGDEGVALRQHVHVEEGLRLVDEGVATSKGFQIQWANQ